MILHNGIKYTIRGSSEDNGQFDHYFYTKTITNTYNNIIYKGYNAVLTKTYTAYFDEDTCEPQETFINIGSTGGYISQLPYVAIHSKIIRLTYKYKVCNSRIGVVGNDNQELC